MKTLNPFEKHLILYCKGWYSVQKVTHIEGLQRIWAIRCGYGVESIDNGCLEHIANSLFEIIIKCKPDLDIISFQKILHNEISKTYLDRWRDLRPVEQLIMFYSNVISAMKVKNDKIKIIDLSKPKKQLFKRIIRGNGKYSDYELISK